MENSISNDILSRIDSYTFDMNKWGRKLCKNSAYVLMIVNVTLKLCTNQMMNK